MENLNLPKFYVGQKIICIDAYDTVGLVNRNIYVVRNNFVCKCGHRTVDVGIITWTDGSICSCGKIHHNLYLYKETRFAPIQESKFRAVSFEKIMEETEKICVN